MLINIIEGKKSDFTPVWFMRQAGRYMKDYRKIREKTDFLTMCKTPEIAAEITIQPVKKFDFDAAILFSDIFIPAEPMGVKINYGPEISISPAIKNRKDIERLRIPGDNEYDFIKRTIKIILDELGQEKDLIGFSAAPFTLLAYLVEGKTHRNFEFVKEMLNNLDFDLLMEKITKTIINYIKTQTSSGIKIIQLFDTWVGLLTPEQFKDKVLSYLLKTAEETKKMGAKLIYYFKDGNHLIKEIKRLNDIEVFSVDSSMSLHEFNEKFNGRFILQGNLDPSILLEEKDVIKTEIDNVLNSAKGLKGHIFNLGHGVLPDTPEDSVKFAVDYIHVAKK